MAVLEPGRYPTDPAVAAAQERVQHRRELDLSDVKDQELAQQVLHQAVGDADFYQGRRMLEAYVASQPPNVRAELDAAGVQGDPQALLELANEALGELPSTPEGIDAELDAARKRMREDPKDWFADDRSQLRFRALLRAKQR
jgi:hypothetical protein